MFKASRAAGNTPMSVLVARLLPTHFWPGAHRLALWQALAQSWQVVRRGRLFADLTTGFSCAIARNLRKWFSRNRQTFFPSTARRAAYGTSLALALAPVSEPA